MHYSEIHTLLPFFPGPLYRIFSAALASLFPRRTHVDRRSGTVDGDGVEESVKALGQMVSLFDGHAGIYTAVRGIALAIDLGGSQGVP
jgi:hypothetical protein